MDVHTAFRNAMSSSEPLIAMSDSARKSVGGLAAVGCCEMNSSGTLLRASAPRICSRGIQPEAVIRSSQCARIARLVAGSHRRINRW